MFVFRSNADKKSLGQGLVLFTKILYFLKDRIEHYRYFYFFKLKRYKMLVLGHARLAPRILYCFFNNKIFI